MPHLAGKCDCGRTFHFPKNAVRGDKWKCFNCRKVWTLSNKGQPLQKKGSKAPPKESLPSSPSKSTTTRNHLPNKSKSSSSSGSGCSQIVRFAIIGFVLFVILAAIF